MIDVESRISDSLNARAERSTQVDGLYAGAMRRAGRIRRRRRMFTAVGGVGMAAVVTAGVLLAPRLLPGDSADRPVRFADRGPSSTPAATGGPTTLPAATGVAPAASSPATVGTDRSVLHFDLNLDAVGATASSWTSAVGYEGFAVPLAEGVPRTEVYVGPDAAALDAGRTPPGSYREAADGTRHPLYDEGPREDVTVAGRPGTLQKVTAQPAGSANHGGSVRISPSNAGPVWVLRWQPVDGLHALVQVSGEQARAFTAAAALRLDRSQRCVSPARVTAVPAGAEWTRCTTVVRRNAPVGGGVWISSEQVLALAGGARASVWTEEKRPRHKVDLDHFVANRSVAGHPAQWRTADPHGLWILDFGTAEVFVDATDEAVATALAAGLMVAEDLIRPETWPARPIG